MWFIKKAIVAFHIFQKIFPYLLQEGELKRCIVPYHLSSKVFQPPSPFFLLALIFYPSFSFSILLTPEDKFVAGFSLKPLKKTLQIEVVWRDCNDSNRYESGFWELLFRGLFFSWLFSSIAALEPYRGGTIITHFIPSKVSPSIKPTMK